MKTHFPDDEPKTAAHSHVEVKGVARVDVDDSPVEGTVRVKADLKPGGTLGMLLGEKGLKCDVDVPVPGGRAGRALAGGLASIAGSLLADALRPKPSGKK